MNRTNETGGPTMNDQDEKKAEQAADDESAAEAADAAAEYAAQNAAHYAAEAKDEAAAEIAPDSARSQDTPPTPEDIIIALEAEKAELTDRYVRLAAEMENLRKRTERELADARKYAVSRFAADILSVGDNLNRAKESATDADALFAIVEGIDVTARDLIHILEKHGVVKIPAIGEKFDPNRHQAMFEVPDESVPSGTVVQQVQEGFMIDDRVLRAALVGVSKGGPKQPAMVESQPQQDEPESAENAETESGESNGGPAEATP